MASPALPVLPCLDAMDPERPPPALVSDVLEEIFLRVASPADLARAAAACVSFRFLINSPSFLRRYRSVHPPLFLGFVNRDGIHPVDATHPSAAVSCGFARTVDLSFLPHGFWSVDDVRDGRVLVERKGSFCRCSSPQSLRGYWHIVDPFWRHGGNVVQRDLLDGIKDKIGGIYLLINKPCSLGCRYIYQLG